MKSPKWVLGTELGCSVKVPNTLVAILREYLMANDFSVPIEMTMQCLSLIQHMRCIILIDFQILNHPWTIVSTLVILLNWICKNFIGSCCLSSSRKLAYNFLFLLCSLGFGIRVISTDLSNEHGNSLFIHILCSSLRNISFHL